MKRSVILVTILLLLISGCTRAGSGSDSAPLTGLRLGYMANITHGQALLGIVDGSFAAAAGVKVTPKVFPSGPSAITALLAGSIDVLYVGPSPAVNGYMRSQGKALKVIAGSASGGAVFALRAGLDPNHLDGLRLGSPGLGNTQDVALRYYLATHGLRPVDAGGTVKISPASNADMLSLLARGQLDGAWVPEPWGARLVHEAGAQIILDERDLWPDRRFATTLLVVSTRFLSEHRDVVKRLLAEHVRLTTWMQTHPEEAEERVQSALKTLTDHTLPPSEMAEAYGRIDFLFDPMAASVQEQAGRAYRLGLLGSQKPDLSGLYDLSLLKEVAP